MKLKFREKTFLATLFLFLLFFNAGLFSLAYYTFHTNAKAEEGVCLTGHQVIAESIEKELEYKKYGKKTDEHTILATYGTFYKDDGLFFRLERDGQTIYSGLPDGLTAPLCGYSATRRADGKRYFLITSEIYGGNYVFTYAKDVSYLDEDFKKMATVFGISSLGASVLLAAVLFFVLRRLSYPLEKLSSATKMIADGNYKTRADETGNDEFSSLATDFNRMAEHIDRQVCMLEENSKTKQSMLDNLAHEMRTPLTSIRGYAEYLLNANVEESEKMEAAEYIISESERLKQIGERILDESFIRENGIAAERCDLGIVVYNVTKSLAPIASMEGVALRAEGKSVFAQCDPLLAEMLLSNLADNAIKACRGQGSVTVGCMGDESGATLFVKDTGIGMTEEQLARVTEPFYRTDSSRSRNRGGNGLGLSLCDRIAKAHGTCLHFKSALNKGTSVSVTFTNP